MDSYIVDPLAIVHKASVDFMQRAVDDTVHIVQYDDRLCILEVHLYSDGLEYRVPNLFDCYIRFSNQANYTARVPVSGFNANRNIVYLEITKDITTFLDDRTYVTHGEGVVELSTSSGMACSSPIRIHIDRNPVQE